MTSKSAGKRRVKGGFRDPKLARKAILDAAIELFAERGFKATSTEAIAEKAGYGQATLFNHFGTKKGLLQACLDHTVGAGAETGIENQSLDTLATVLSLHNASNDTKSRFFSRISLEQDSDKEINRLYAEMHGRVRKLLARRLLRESHLDDEGAEFVAGTLVCLLIGVHAGSLVDKKAFSQEQYSAMLELVTRLLVKDNLTSVTVGKQVTRQSKSA